MMASCRLRCVAEVSASLNAPTRGVSVQHPLSGCQQRDPMCACDDLPDLEWASGQSIGCDNPHR